MTASFPSHDVDADRRTVVLAHHVVDGGTMTASIPTTTVVPPGSYYVFLVKDNGQGPTPSVAEVVGVIG